MKTSYKPRLYLALMHFPVINKNGDTIASAITNLDLHDIARAAKTYGVNAFYVVSPLVDQRELAKKIIGHWTEGSGAVYNPKRRDALELIRIRETIEAVVDDIKRREGGTPRTVATCARNRKGAIGYGDLRKRLKNGEPHLLTFGTAWGLSESFIGRADFVLEPVNGEGDYNHLSVRSAASIILDRLMGHYH